MKAMMSGVAAACLCAFCGSAEMAEWTWIDGTRLPIEGKAFADTERYYDRLPACWSNDYTKSVWSLQRHSAGLAFRFVTDAEKLRVRWSLTGANLAMAHMPATGVSGVDVYQYGTNPSPETTQGGCTSRPSAAWPSIVGMEADVPIVNLGFSGSGQMEDIMVDVLARIDASLYVLDTIGNVNVKLIGERDTFVPDRNYAVEGVHLNDWGAWNVGRGFAKAVSAALAANRGAVQLH